MTAIDGLKAAIDELKAGIDELKAAISVRGTVSSSSADRTIKYYKAGIEWPE